MGPDLKKESHILESSDVYYRYVEVRVKFEKEFYTIPEVALAPSKMELEPNFPIGFTIELVEVNKKGKNVL